MILEKGDIEACKKFVFEMMNKNYWIKDVVVWYLIWLIDFLFVKGSYKLVNVYKDKIEGIRWNFLGVC